MSNAQPLDINAGSISHTSSYLSIACQLCVFMLCGAFLALMINRIDFHADESIYLHGVPISTSNDTGLVFHLSYLLSGAGQPTPLSARWTSFVFGMILIVATTRTTQNLTETSRFWIGVLTPILIVVSYQGVFSILRVRPEISWIAMTSVACCCLSEIRKYNSPWAKWLLVVALLILPMNHMLSLFSCLCIGLYLVLFGWRFLGVRLVLLACFVMALGFVLNTVTRNMLVNGNLIWLPGIGGGAGTQRPALSEFLKNVFWGSPLFLNDAAASRSLWNRLLPWESTAFISHFFVAAMIWAAAIPAAVLGRNWEQRFAFGVPLLILGLFYGSGYFNPTYSTLLVIYSTLVFLFIASDVRQWRILRFVAAGVLLVSVLNGVSFVSTRVLNHGTASYFDVERDLRAYVRSLPVDASLAIPERFWNIVPADHAAPKIVFKEELPEDLDVLIVDNYDFDMYRFVPDYDRKRSDIEARLAAYAPVRQRDELVYRNERLSDAAKNNSSIAAVQGSWFFRNSTQYRVSLVASPGSDQIAGAKDASAVEGISMMEYLANRQFEQIKKMSEAIEEEVKKLEDALQAAGDDGAAKEIGAEQEVASDNSKNTASR